MAQWRTDLNEFKQPHNVHLYELGMIATVDGNPVTNTNPFPVTGNVGINGTINADVTFGGASPQTSAFGESYGLTITPVIQVDAIYGITNEVIQSYTYGTGAYANSDLQVYRVQTGTDLYGYGVIRSKRFLRYRPGQGALCRFTAAFSNGVSQSTQRAGLFNQENAIQFGYDGTDFGVLRATGGKAEIRQLSINSVSTGDQTVTLTLNGTAYTQTINTANTYTAAVQLAARVGGYGGYLVDQVDNTLVFLSPSLGPQNGTFSISSNGTISGTFARLQTGVAQTDMWTKQADWNIDTLGANTARNPSGMSLVKHNLNIYQIQFRWLGAGQIVYSVEDANTGNIIPVHKEHYVGTSRIPHTANPSFKIGYVAYSVGSNTNLEVVGSSMFGAIEGTIFKNELIRSSGVSKVSLAKDDFHHMLTLRNPYVTNGKAGSLNGQYILNAKEIILENISVGTQGNDPCIVYVFYEPTSFTGTHTFLSQPKDNGMISTADGTLNPNVDTAILRFVTSINGQSSFDLKPYRIAVPPNSTISIAIQSSAAISRASVAVVFSED